MQKDRKNYKKNANNENQSYLVFRIHSVETLQNAQNADKIIEPNIGLYYLKIMEEEKRKIQDRRTKPTPFLSKYTFRGRRKAHRRKDEGTNYYVDLYEAKHLIIIVSIILLCILDAYMTLKLLQHGGVELNPIMAILIKKDALLFLLVKITITVFCVIFLLIHKNFQILVKLKINYIIYLVFFVYFVLILYELYLFWTNVKG